MTDAIDKIDLKTFIGDLEKEEKPKTLEECLKEAGGFPFAAKAVVEFSDSVWPLGATVTCFDVIPFKDGRLFATKENHGSLDHYPRAVITNASRWQLLGHKT